jgi:ketosteroid isomerase-like protein
LRLASTSPCWAGQKTTAVDTQKLFETEWVHVFTVKSGKITRWRGFFNTAARYR